MKNVRMQRRPGIHPLAPDVRLDDVVAHEQHDGFERAHEPVGTGRPDFRYRRTTVVTSRSTTRRDQPEHEDVLGDRQIDSRDRRQVNQRMIERAVGDVIDDRLAGVEAFRRRVAAAVCGGLGCVVCGLRRVFLSQHLFVI